MKLNCFTMLAAFTAFFLLPDSMVGEAETQCTAVLPLVYE